MEEKRTGREPRAMKRIFACMLSAVLIFSLAGCFNRDDELTAEKPVIYLYPEQETEVAVRLDYDGRLTAAYPAYQDGWTVTAQPDGTLTDQKGMEYRYLYWEGTDETRYDFSRGFCVKGGDTAAFLEQALAEIGLNRAEANEFIIYWLPRMEANEWNLISFQQEAYRESAKLIVDPAPDSMLRVFMAWKPAEQNIPIEPQEFEPFDRDGFTVVEWGGCEVKG